MAALLENSTKIQKAIIYVGTKEHARALYQLLKSTTLADRYDSIGIILGDERRRYASATLSEIAGEPRDEFISAQKSSIRSILVNVDVLTEGYDDPSVNTIVMARPTNSKLVYMQALGRAVRIDPNNNAKEAYVVEVVDNLPNIKYRIDNRWLYSDISDQLEPDVIDVFYPHSEALPEKITEIFDTFRIRPEYRIIPPYSSRDRITMLLFKVYAGNDKYNHIPVLITNETRQAATGFFDFIATRMRQFDGLNAETIWRPVLTLATRFPALENPNTRKNVLEAMENAWALVAKEAGVDAAVDAGRPWITFVSFRLQMSEESLGTDLLQFTEDMLNKETIRATLRTGSIGNDFVLVKFPLPLRGTSGVFLPSPEFAILEEAIDKLSASALERDGATQWQAAVSILGTATISVEQRHIQSLTTIVRENIDYFRHLNRLAVREPK